MLHGFVVIAPSLIIPCHSSSDNIQHIQSATLPELLANHPISRAKTFTSVLHNQPTRPVALQVRLPTVCHQHTSTRQMPSPVLTSAIGRAWQGWRRRVLWTPLRLPPLLSCPRPHLHHQRLLRNSKHSHLPPNRASMRSPNRRHQRSRRTKTKNFE